MTPIECARLQSLGELEHLPNVPTRVYAALGNAVNAHVVQLIAAALFATPLAAHVQIVVPADPDHRLLDLVFDTDEPQELIAA